MIRKGQEVKFKPEWQDAGDDKITFIAIEDESDGFVTVQAQLAMRINPTQKVPTYMIASDTE